VFFFIVRSGVYRIPNEAVLAVLAYDLETALARAKNDAGALDITYRGQNISIYRLIEKLHLDTVVSPPTTETKPISDMYIGELGYVTSWAVEGWNRPFPGYLDGMNLSYSVFPAPFGTANLPICRTVTGWVVSGKVFTIPK